MFVLMSSGRQSGGGDRCTGPMTERFGATGAYTSDIDRDILGPCLLHRVDGPAEVTHPVGVRHDGWFLWGVQLTADEHTAVVGEPVTLRMFEELAPGSQGTGSELAEVVLGFA